jgi:UbiD family decarboxylase
MAAIKDLREYIALIEAKGQLKRISAPVDPKLEIGEITDRVSKAYGPGLIFENPVNRETGETRISFMNPNSLSQITLIPINIAVNSSV